MNWISSYIDYTFGQESPERFHMWSAITAIGAVLGRKVWLNRRSYGITRYRLYPGQIMVVLVGASGRVRKTTALKAVKPFLKGVKLIQGKSSPEGFLDQLDIAKGGFPQAMLFESELSMFLSKQTYAEPLIDILMKMADGEDTTEFVTRKGGHIIIKDPLLTILGATTPISLGESIPEKAHSAGFLSRIIFVYEESSDRVEDLLDIDDEDVTKEELLKYKELETRLTEKVEEYSHLEGAFSLTARAKEWMRAFYKEWVEGPGGKEEGWAARRADHMLRLAMILSVAGGFGLLIPEQILQLTDILLSDVERDLPKALVYVGTSYTNERERILTAIRTADGRISSTGLWKKVHKYFPDSDSIRKTLQLLRDANEVHLTMVGGREIWSLRSPSYTDAEEENQNGCDIPHHT